MNALIGGVRFRQFDRFLRRLLLNLHFEPLDQVRNRVGTIHLSPHRAVIIFIVKLPDGAIVDLEQTCTAPRKFTRVRRAINALG